MDVSDPEPASGATLLRTAIVAGVLCVAAVLVAPAAWPAGEGQLRVDQAGGATAAGQVVVGDEAERQLPLPEVGLVVDLPLGLPLDQEILATVSAADGADLSLDEVALTLLLPDGREERLPVVDGEDRDGQQVVTARRRPPADAAVVLGLLAVVATFWVSGALPLHVPSLLVPVVLAGSGASDPEQALAPFFHPIIALFFAGFLMAEAMKRVGLDRRIATLVVARAGASPARLFATLLALAAGLSMFMSNTAAVAVLVPIALAVSAPLEDRGYTRVLVLGLAYAATVGGVGSAIGTPANPLAIDFLAEATGERITFGGWFLIGLPFLVVFLPLMGLVLWRRAGLTLDPVAFEEARVAAREAVRAQGRPGRDEAVVLVVFLVVVAVWLAQPLHGVDTGIVALGGAVALAVLGRITSADLGRISWSSLLTFGGGLALGLALTGSGTADWVATQLSGLTELPSLVGVAVVAAVVLLTTTIASNTAAAAIMIPLAIPLATVVGVAPATLVIVVAIASSIDFALVIGTPPTMMAYSTGLFTPRDILRAGAPLDVIGLTLLVVVLPPIWDALGVT